MRFLVWTGIEEWLTETAAIDFGADGLRAIGTQLGADPVPYRVDYRLEAPDRFVTSELELTATAEGWRRRLLLRHDGSGGWSAEVEDDGQVSGGPWDGDLPDLSDALDIDLGFSPLTNSMPILREQLHRREGSRDLVMAWVSIPDLRVTASRQRYQYLSSTEEGAIVRFVEVDDDFTADLELDGDGLLVLYPRLARRVEPGLKVG